MQKSDKIRAFTDFKLFRNKKQRGKSPQPTTTTTTTTTT